MTYEWTLGSHRQPRSLSCQWGPSLPQPNVGLPVYSTGWPYPQGNGGGQELCPAALWALGFPTQAWAWPGTKSWPVRMGEGEEISSPWGQ